MGEETSSIYNAIIASLIIGIIITIVVLFITFEPEEYFTEIYFEDHEALPEKVKLNNYYNFSFTIHSLENSTKNYNYQSIIELYNLYDITEGTYRCLGKFRDKISLEWELGELMDNNTYSTIKNILNDNQNNELIKNAYTQTIGGFQLENIEWDKYTVDFSYHAIDGLGYISLIFIDEAGNNKYALMLSESKNKVLFIKFDGNQIRINKKDYEFVTGRSYKITINSEKDKADIYINDQKIFNIKDINLKNKKIGFETRNTYAYIRSLSVFKYDYNLKDPSTIKTYDLDESVTAEKHNELVDKKIDYLKLKTFTDENSSLFVDNVHEWINLDNEKGSYNQSYKIKSYEGKDEEIVSWTKYAFGYDYETVQGDGEILALFENSGKIKYGFLVIEKTNQTFFLRVMDGKLKISKKAVPIAAGKHNVRIMVDKNNAETYFGDKLIFNISDLTEYTNGKIGFELKNTNAVIENVYAQNEGINYSDPTLYAKYKKKYAVEKSELAEAKTTPLQDKEIFTTPVAVKEAYVKDLIDRLDINVENEAAKARIKDLILEKGMFANTEDAKEALIKEITANPELVNDFIKIADANNLIQEKEMLANSDNIKEVLIKELISNPKLITDFINIIGQSESKKTNQDTSTNIPSKSMVFNGYNARILNWTGYVFTFGYTALDGKKEIINSFQDFDGNNKYSFLMSEQASNMAFTDHEYNKKIKKDITIGGESWHTVKLEVNEDKAEYYLDGRLVFNLSNVDFTTGQFSLETQSTNAHFRQIFALNNDGQRKIYEIQDDPCELQKIGEAMLDKGNIIIEAGQKMTKGQTLNVNQLFDFGKVIINVDDMEIHFWVTNI